MKREISKLFKSRAEQFFLNDSNLASRNLNEDSFDILLAMAMISLGKGSDTMKKSIIRHFLGNYIRPFTPHLFHKNLSNLIENNYVWENNLQSVTISKLGLKEIEKIYGAMRHFEKQSLKPILLSLSNGKVDVEGLIISKANLRKNSPNNPYKGVKRVGAHGWRATLTHQGKKVDLGIFPKALTAAKARDRYITENKLHKTMKSL